MLVRLTLYRFGRNDWQFNSSSSIYLCSAVKFIGCNVEHHCAIICIICTIGETDNMQDASKDNMRTAIPLPLRAIIDAIDSESRPGMPPYQMRIWIIK